MKRWILILLAALVTVLALGAGAVAVSVGGDADGPGSMMSRQGPDGFHGPMAGRGSGMRGAMSGGMHGMRVTSERAWLTEMVAHHQEAVDAAGELARSERSEMRDFGAAIIADQSAQIDLMESWLDDWYGGPDTDVEYRPMMRDLSGLSGDPLDRVFLQDMVRHHMMAVMMSQHLLVRDLADHEEVADLAEDIRDAQHQEIFQMQRWLADWFGVRRGMGMGPGAGMMRPR